MSIKMLFEIGHLASRKTKPSKEGFTHDWEMFVRGPGGSEISHFVEKVVFNLHESFPKPKRIIKDPPYSVKEAGYAGFVLTIDICFKNREEPKKVTFEYDLDLQPFKTQTNEFIVAVPTDEFKRKCLKGGCMMINPGDYKSREPYKNPPIPSTADPKKIIKRVEETKPNKTFTELFGAPLKKPEPKTVQNASPTSTKFTATKTSDKISIPSSSGAKEKSEKSKHKHSPTKDGKDAKKSSDSRSEMPEKSKKDRTKDRERSEKKDKLSKRQPSPPQSFLPSSQPRNSTNLNSVAQLKTDLGKSKPQSSTSVTTNDSSFSKKSSKKDKKSDKDRDRNDKKESRAKESSKEKAESLPKGSSSAQKARGPLPTKDEREKSRIKSTPLVQEAITKNKHKKREKTKDRDVKKEKQHKISPVTSASAKAQDTVTTKYEQTATKSSFSDKDLSESDADSPPSIKQESENSLSDSIVQKLPQLVEKAQKKPRERAKVAEKDEKSRKRKASKKEDRDFDSIPPSKQPRKDLSKSPSLQERPTSSDAQTNNSDVTSKLPSDIYMTELKDLKHKITTLKNNDDLQTVVRMIAATGCYEITKSSFDFDLVQLDRGTVAKLQKLLQQISN